MMKVLLPLTIIAPVVLAWVLSRSICMPLPGTDACTQASDDLREVFWSFAIMFCIATWIPALLSYLIIRSRRTGP